MVNLPIIMHRMADVCDRRPAECVYLYVGSPSSVNKITHHGPSNALKICDCIATQDKKKTRR